jgi:hypothetical protein
MILPCDIKQQKRASTLSGRKASDKSKINLAAEQELGIGTPHDLEGYAILEGHRVTNR